MTMTILEVTKRFLGAGQSTLPQPVLGEELVVDVHAHWLPGIDDGAQTVEEGLMLVKGLAELGYQKLVATPHVMRGYFGNTREKILQAFSDFLRPVLLADIEIDLAVAAEYMLDQDFVQHMDSGLLTLADRHVLIEMPLDRPFRPVKDLIIELFVQGYVPLLAHPERYSYYHQHLEELEALKNLGCLFQLNMLALSGFYGKPEAVAAQKMLKRGWYDHMGTDVHDLLQLELLSDLRLPLLLDNRSLSWPAKNYRPS